MALSQRQSQVWSVIGDILASGGRSDTAGPMTPQNIATEALRRKPSLKGDGQTPMQFQREVVALLNEMGFSSNGSMASRFERDDKGRKENDNLTNNLDKQPGSSFSMGGGAGRLFDSVTAGEASDLMSRYADLLRKSPRAAAAFSLSGGPSRDEVLAEVLLGERHLPSAREGPAAVINTMDSGSLAPGAMALAVGAVAAQHLPEDRAAGLARMLRDNTYGSGR